MKIIIKIFCFTCLLILSKSNYAQSNTTIGNSSEKLNLAIGLLQFYNVPEIPISVFDATDSFSIFDVTTEKNITCELIKINISYKANGKLNSFNPVKGKIGKKDLEKLKKLPIGTTIYITEVIVKLPNEKIMSLPNYSFKLSRWKILN